MRRDFGCPGDPQQLHGTDAGGCAKAPRHGVAAFFFTTSRAEWAGCASRLHRAPVLRTQTPCAEPVDQTELPGSPLPPICGHRRPTAPGSGHELRSPFQTGQSSALLNHPRHRCLNGGQFQVGPGRLSATSADARFSAPASFQFRHSCCGLWRPKATPSIGATASKARRAGEHGAARRTAGFFRSVWSAVPAD